MKTNITVERISNVTEFSKLNPGDFFIDNYDNLSMKIEKVEWLNAVRISDGTLGEYDLDTLVFPATCEIVAKVVQRQ